jgi:hypothetical protein
MAALPTSPRRSYAAITFLEPLLGLLAAGVEVRVQPLGQPMIGFLDVALRGVLRCSQDSMKDR